MRYICVFNSTIMRSFLFAIFFFICWMPVWAQGGSSTFDYLLLPHSARSAAVGGTNLSAIANDASLIYDNPAFLGYEMDKTLLFSYLPYIADVGIGNISFTKKWNEKSSFGIGALYAHYGQMLEVSENGDILGDLRANDICGTLFFAHDITNKLRGGISGKFLYSNYAYNTAIGIGVDLGLSYYNEEHGFSWGLTGKNIGRQIKAYEDNLAVLPWDIQFGITQKLAHAPIRFSVTAIHLKSWEFEDGYSKNDKFLPTLFKHLIVGVELLPSDNFWIGIGCNAKRVVDMSLTEGNKLGGFSAGFGFHVKSFDIGCAFGRYNTGATSFMLSLSTNFIEMQL
ncbi:MAG: hypothetical protein EZS26_002579 [Candidatus Ordinivivax streblomastigis]|uniref:Type IX secretion system protein PorQ n=1 Tax=Candidatus Ordinivivax streblomastigis TaxID=2540710 RepID=A0A5M8NX44_9BACT|nr:MAG: hypothetical protein EZS26_002579 [Candidatus Ordinivivax streblomastigis]